MKRKPSYSAVLLRDIRTSKRWSRAQVGRWLGTTETVVYNLETGRSRVELAHFMKALTRLKLELSQLVSAHTFTVQTPALTSPAAVVAFFRKRLGMSQKQVGIELGYRGGAMIHHFEKGIRQPSLDDFFNLMALNGDDVAGLVRAVCPTSRIADELPQGRAAAHKAWREYWERPWIAGLRQLLRTTKYRVRTTPYRPGEFADRLGISLGQEREALSILEILGVMKWRKSVPQIDQSVQILIPKYMPAEVVKQFKRYWFEKSLKELEDSPKASHLHSIDLIPTNAELTDKIHELVREGQDRVHHLNLNDTDAFSCISWMVVSY